MNRKTIRALRVLNASAEQPTITNPEQYRWITHHTTVWTNPADHSDVKNVRYRQAFLPAQHPKRQNKIAKYMHRMLASNLTRTNMSKQQKHAAMRQLTDNIKQAAANINAATVAGLANSTPQVLASQLVYSQKSTANKAAAIMQAAR